jgi:hypothetical protein
MLALTPAETAVRNAAVVAAARELRAAAPAKPAKSPCLPAPGAPRSTGPRE